MKAKSICEAVPLIVLGFLNLIFLLRVSTGVSRGSVFCRNPFITEESCSELYYIDESVLLGTKPLVDSICHFIRDPSGVFSVCHLCECRIVQWNQVSLKVYLNSLVYHRNIFGSSSVPRKSSAIFGNFRKMFGNVRLVFGTIWENLRKSSENHQKRRHQYVYIIKRTLHGGLKIWILFSRGKNNILLTRCARS